jgi:hypothetical protein
MILSLLLFLGANIGLIFIKNLAAFMVLRGLQAASGAPLTILGEYAMNVVDHLINIDNRPRCHS